MKPENALSQIMNLALTLWLLAACGGGSPKPTIEPTPIPATPTEVVTAPAEPGEYEVSLDYGPECHGAGACHYGSLAGKQVASNQPESTRNIPYEADRAQHVMLENGIEGYFIEAECGANCDDSRVYWVVDGFQYMLGLKGGQQGDVVDLANAAIMNSMWVTSVTPLVATPGSMIESFTIQVVKILRQVEKI